MWGGPSVTHKGKQNHGPKLTTGLERDVAGAKGGMAVADSISISVAEDAPRNADGAERATLLTAWRSCPGDQV